MRYVIAYSVASAMIFSAGLANAEVPKVVTDIPPVQALVAAVMGDLGSPSLLLTPGASEHDFQMKPSQARDVAAADLVVMVGPELTPWLEKPLNLRPADAAVLALLASEQTWRQDYAPALAAATADHDHDHDHDHGDDAQGHAHAAPTGHDHDHDHAMAHSHDSDGIDPHAWLDPANATLWLAEISSTLAKLDPEHAATYASNAVIASEAIAAADAEARIVLAPVQDKPFATAHAAFGYFAHYYDLTLAGTVADGDAATPGAGHVTDLRALAEAGQITCLFPEAGHDPALLQRIAEGTPTRIGATLDPLGSGLPGGPGLYPALIRSSAKTLADCLSAGQ